VLPAKLILLSGTQEGRANAAGTAVAGPREPAASGGRRDGRRSGQSSSCEPASFRRGTLEIQGTRFPACLHGDSSNIAPRAARSNVRDLPRLLAKAVVDDRLLTYAAAIAFQALIALIPLTLLALGLLGAFGLEDTWAHSIAPAIKHKVTAPVFKAIDYTVRRVLDHGSGGLITFAVLLSTWYLAAAMRAVMEALNQIHEIEDRRPWWKRGLISAGLAVAVGTCLIGSVLVLIVAPRVVQHGAGHVLLGLGRWLVALLLLAFAVALLVRYAPAEHPQPRWASAGSALVVVSWVVAAILFRLLVSLVLNFRSPSGSLTGLIALNGFLFTSALVFLIGVELDEMLRAGPKRRAAGARRTRR
jgi:membrane protein